MVLGDIVSHDLEQDYALDLLNEEITIEASLRLKENAQKAVAFLQQENVLAKTLEPNFCHAKMYLQRTAADDPQKNYYVLGSSNLTEAGLGMKATSNVELNQAGFGSASDYQELVKWFEALWNRPQAHDHKTIEGANGKAQKQFFKDYLIDEIKKIFKAYTPLELYYKVLFELFGEELLLQKNDPEFSRKFGKLENTIIYRILYPFQQKGVLSLIKMLQRYNGAILADAVGLGKTWSALAVMRFFQAEGCEVILLCPKKLENNWKQYQRKQASKFQRDELDYVIRFHTDLDVNRMNSYPLGMDYLCSKRPKLFVIDESHNLRNDKSKRYQFFIEEVLSKNEDAKVLMISATPINNNLNDIRNQFKLITKGNDHGFKESLDIRSTDYVFRMAQRAFKQWSDEPDVKIGDLIRELPDNFFRLSDSLIVSRTRNMIADDVPFEFPKKASPTNVFKTPKQLGNIESFKELTEAFPEMLSGYTPSIYAESKEDYKKRMAAKRKGIGISVLDDEQQRDRFLVKMIYILMVKRLESSWSSFFNTVNKVLIHHQNALDRISKYQELKSDNGIDDDEGEVLWDDDDLLAELDEFTLGKKRKISLREIDMAGRLNEYKKHLKTDIKALQFLATNLEVFEHKIDAELQVKRNLKSADTKLQALIEQIIQKRGRTVNSNNQKVLVFTVYKDTAFYLFDQLKARGFERIAVVSGDASKTSDSEQSSNQFEDILERFAPFTKLFIEKEWDFIPSKADLSLQQQFSEWCDWVAFERPQVSKKLQNPIDILIATDTLSEGQNLQDCDMVINYDIHWNPVRVIQRMGRIDRLGSPNEEIFGVNFWPSDSIEEYLNLKKRVEKRMAAMVLAGAEVQSDFTDRFKEMSENEDLAEKQKGKMLRQMETSWEDIEISDKNFGFNDLSLESFRQELMEQLRDKEKYYRGMPRGVFTGFKAAHESCPESGIIALMGYPSRKAATPNHQYKSYALIYIDENGKDVHLNHKEVLDALSQHKNESRFVDKTIDQGDESAIKKLSGAFGQWLSNQARATETDDEGNEKYMAGKATLDLINKVKRGSKEALDQLKTEGKPADKFIKENFDLITWFIVS